MENEEIKNFDFGNSALIESSAGTGKTFTITLLVLRLLLGEKRINGEKRPLDIENILVVTFTNAAAAELKARILSRITSTRKLFDQLQKFCDEISENLDHVNFISKLTFKDNEAKNNTQIFSKNDEQIVEILWNIYQETPDTSNLKNKLKLYSRLLLRAERSIDNAPISTIHSFCNRALNQIYSFEAGKAFNVELTPDVDKYKEMAIVEVWRDMFYKDSDLDKEQLHSILQLNDPQVFSDLMNKIAKVQSIDPHAKDTYYGFYINDIYEADSFFSKPQKTPEERLRYILKKAKECDDKYREEINSFFKAVLNFSPFKEEGIDSLYLDKEKLTSAAKSFFKQIEDYNLRKSDINKDLPEKFLSTFEPLILNLPDNKPDKITFSGKNTKNYKNQTQTLEFESIVNKLKKQVKLKQEEQDVIYKEISFNIAVTMHRRFKEICTSYNVISLDQVLFELAECLCTSSENETIRDRANNLSNLLRRRYPVALIDEFQDTDPIQFEIFNSIYFKDTSNNSVCYLIGDPKQSIYRFRGSDINSYNKAKLSIEAKKGKRYELPTNYRSSSAIVEGVNAIFKEVPSKEAPSVAPDYPYLSNAFKYDVNYLDCNISFSPADFDINNKGTGIIFGDDENTLINNTVVNIELELDEKKNIKSDTLRKVVARAAAEDISKCLRTARFSDTKEKVKPGDIAVLVRTGKESQEIINALREINIPAVYYSDKSSVLFEYENNHGSITRKPSEAALNIIYLMEAVCDFTKKEKLARLYGSNLISQDFNEFKEIINTDKIDEEILLLSECLKKWESFGFATAFFYFLMKKDLFIRIMSLDSGERALTDYVHISEIIQTQHGKIRGAKSQMLWFKDMLFSSENDYYDSDFEKKRLESEKSLVKIYTIHSSKGLQFPLVFLPYLYNVEGSMDESVKSICGANRKIYTYFDPKKQHLSITFNEDFSVIKTDNKDINAKEIVHQEVLQENVRLAYVALTRAKRANFIYIPRDNFKVQNKNIDSAFRAIITPKNKDYSNLKAIDSKDPIISDLFSPEEKKMTELLDNAVFKMNSYQGVIDENKEEESKTEYDDPKDLLKDIKISDCFSIHSYSSIKGAHAHGTALDNNNEEDKSKEKTADKNEIKLDDIRLNFARSHGVKANDAGVIFHKLMELILQNGKLLYELNSEINSGIKNSDNLSEILYKHYIGSNDKLLSAEELRLKSKILSFKFSDKENKDFFKWVVEVLLTDIKLTKDENGLTSNLIKLSPSSCACEMEYYLPSKKGSHIELNKICNDLHVQVFGPQENSISSVKEMDFKGYVKGEMDLVAQFEEHGPFYLIDYKTNYLGNKLSDYGENSIAKSIFDSGYDVQILLYSIALHRFLKNTVENYCDDKGDAKKGYEELFGGVIYLYVRGMTPKDKKYGVFYVKPDLELIEKLDKELFGDQVKD